MNQSIPLKYRPEQFKDLVGQEVNSRFLSTLIKRGQIGKNIILYGAYGSSKTTSCRIYARALNCLHPTPEGEPCNICENCILFYEDRYSDYLEVDGSSKGGKDSIKELVDVAKTPPLMGKYRIINIDECQGLSKQAWDTLLKLIEEPPPYLVFIFTTTERDKVREAIRSRCQELEVKLLDHQRSVNHLVKVCGLEQILFEPDALELLAFLSGGHARDLLKNMEQVNYLGDITLENVRSMFNLGYIENVYKYFQSIFDGNISESSAAIKKILEEGYEAGQVYKFLQEFIIYFYYNVVAGTTLTVNPVLEAIPKGDYQILFKNLMRISDEHKIAGEIASEAILEMFGSNRVQNKVELDLFTVNLICFIHRYNFRMGTFGQEPHEQVSNQHKMGRNGTSRRFVGSYKSKSSNQELEQDIPAISTNSVVNKVYAHNLTQYNFTQIDKSTTRIIQI